MRIIKREAITVPERQRRERKPETVRSLTTSILTKGLLHPPVVAPGDTPDTFVLIAGETRLLAIEAIASERLPFTCDGKVITPGEVPVTLLFDLSPADLFETEFEENEFREPLSWQDRTRALAKIHELRQTTNPSQTFKATGEALIAASPSASLGNVRSASWLGTKVREATILARHLDDPKIAASRNATEALAAVLKRESDSVEAELIRRRLKSAETTNLVEVRHGSALDILPSLEAHQFDLIIVDPPYGIKADAAGMRQRSSQHHNYDDSPQIAHDLITCIVQEGFRLTKQRANLFAFGDIDTFPLFKTLCGQMGWVPFRTPITWRKGNEGLAPWGSSGFRRASEWIFFATKGQKGLLQSPTDVLDFKRVARDEREYGAEKPLDLLRFLIEISTFPGDRILDPCCGSGASLQAARQLKRRALGIELDRDAFTLATVKAQRDEPAVDVPLPL